MKNTPEQAKEELEAAGLTVQPHEAFPEILLCSGGDAAALPAFIEGRVTVQDAASALAAAVADPKPGSTVLDCCAAPGGKSFAMAEKMQGKGSVTSCDIYEHKLKRIRDGAARLGLPNIRTELQDASVCREEWKDSADVVLCCATCPAQDWALSARNPKFGSRIRTKFRLCRRFRRESLQTVHSM